MNLLDDTGLGLAFKKGYLKIDGDIDVIGGWVYLMNAEPISFKGKTTIQYQVPHYITLSRRYVALVDYNEELVLNGMVGGPTILSGHELPAINLRIRMEKDIDLDASDYIVKLAIAKISI